MPNGTYGGVKGKEAKIGRKTFVSLPTRFLDYCSAALPELLLPLFQSVTLLPVSMVVSSDPPFWVMYNVSETCTVLLVKIICAFLLSVFSFLLMMKNA